MGKIDIVKALTELDEGLVVEGVKEQMAASVPAFEILAQLQAGMEQVGKLFETGDYFLSELIMSADVFSGAAKILDEVLVSGRESKTLGTMVLGTVKGDIHDIGKNIVATLLSCNGFKVIDLGVDAPIASFVEAARVHKPQVVGMCCLLTTEFDTMKETVAAVKEACPDTPVLIGGGPVDLNVMKYCGADGYCKNAYVAVELTKKYSGVN